MRSPAAMLILPRTARSRRIAGLSTACAMVLGVGAGTAMFVDYLADRAMARAADSAPAPAVHQVRLAFDSTVANDGEAEGAKPGPAIRPPEIVVRAPVPVAAPSENAIEIPLDDPTAKPILQLDQIETAALEEEPDSAVEAAAFEDVPAVGDDDAADPSTADLPEPEIAPKKLKPAARTAEKSPPQEDTTSLAALPGVDIGGLAGNPARENTGTSRTARIAKSVNMRANGKKGAQILGVVPAGATVSLHGCDQWCEISYKGRRGFVYKSFVGSPKPAEAAAKTSANQASVADAAQGKRVLSSRAQ